MKHQSSSRQDWLDWLRAVAILLVLGSHYQIDWWDAGIFRPWAQFNMRLGWSGVDMFFVISGFLIGGLLINELKEFGSIDTKRFYIRRTTKIWPLLYLVPLIYVIFFYRFSDSSRMSVLISFLPTFLHVQNYFVSPMGHLWSLAVEEHFYLLLPLLMIAVWKVSNRQSAPVLFLKVLLSAIILVISLRVFAVYSLEIQPGIIRAQTQYRLDGLLTGVSLAWLYHYDAGTWHRIQNSNKTIYVMIFCLWPFAFNPNHSLILSSVGFSFLSVAYAGSIFLVLRFSEIIRNIVVVGMVLRWLAWIGRRSYPIYLFHPFVWLMMISLGLPRISKTLGFFGQSLLWFSGYIAFTFTSIILGALVAMIAEKPLLILRNSLFPARSLALKN